MEFRILGPLEVVDGERTLPLGARKRRALLAVLLLRRGQVVSVDEIVEALWGAEPPRTAEHSVQVYVSELRKVLSADPDADAPVAITLQPPGYAMRVPTEALDVDRSERLAQLGRAAMAAGDPRGAAALLGEALDLWRGPPLADFAYDDFARGDIEALEELRLGMTEDRIDADLALGRHAETVAELQTLVDAHPFRERLRTSLMLALYRSGRQAEALQGFHRARTLLADDLGIDPGHELAGLATAILAQDPALAWRPSATNAPSTDPPVGDTADDDAPYPAPTPPETSPARRIVSVLVAELQVRDGDGASIDPEASAPVATRASDLVGETLERHRATIVPRDGSALVALFGSPVAHEDDALRSVRAAVEIRERVDGLNAELTDDHGVAVTTRIGVHTGEILSGGGDDPAALASEAIQRARHLAATPGAAGPVVDEATLALLKDAVTVVPLDGTPGMYRLVEVHPRASGWSRRMDSPIVGRDAELADLARSFERVHATRSCVLLTVFGDAGIGKTRLVDEFTQRVANDAQVLEGRCLAYGDGITYWPIAEAIRAVASVHDDDDAADIRRKLATDLADDADRERIVQGLSHILGVADIELSQGEALWAVRRFLGSLATDGPVVLLVEDVHWAEPTLLDLLESIADWMRDTPLLVICTARPDVFDQRPGWGGGRPNVATLSLRPLSPEDTDLLIENLVHHPGLDAEAKSRIAEAAEGNPLFVEQLLSMLVDEGLLRQDAGQWSLATDLSSVSLPTSLQTLLSARLDRLPASDRAVLGIASVIGRTFDVETVEALTSPEERDGVRASVHRLVAKDLVRPERTPNGDGFRFRHVLIMNATYEALPKRRRAELHEVIADRLEATAGEQAAGYDEIVGDHLARAADYLQELAPDDEHARALRDRSGRRLAAGAARAFARGDMPAAASLYATAARMLPADDQQRLAFLPELGNAFIEIGRMDDADRVFAEAIDEGTRRDDLRVVADALLYRFEAEVWRGMMDEANESVALARQLIPQAEATGDDLVQQRAWSILGMWAPSWAEQEEFTQRAMRFAERAGDIKGRNENIQMASGLLHMGPMPVEDALRVSEDYLERTAGDRVMEAAIIVNARAPLLARAGRMTDARAEYERARTTFRELGLPLWLGASGTIGPSIAELVAGDPAIAQEMTEEAIARLEHINARGNWLVDVLQLSAYALLGLGRTREAGAALTRLEMVAHPTNPFLLWVRGSLALAEGRTREAIAEMRAALEEADDDLLPARGDITLDLAHALRADGNDDEARQAAAQALGMFERKGDVVSAARARAFLESG